MSYPRPRAQRHLSILAQTHPGGIRHFAPHASHQGSSFRVYIICLKNFFLDNLKIMQSQDDEILLEENIRDLSLILFRMFCRLFPDYPLVNVLKF